MGSKRTHLECAPQNQEVKVAKDQELADMKNRLRDRDLEVRGATWRMRDVIRKKGGGFRVLLQREGGIELTVAAEEIT